MQESNLDKLLTENKVSHPFFVGMEEVNKEWVNSLKEEGLQSPSAETMETIRKWYDKYRQLNPKASVTNAKRATIRHFNLIIKK